jgi:hypothetical protein
MSETPGFVSKSVKIKHCISFSGGESAGAAGGISADDDAAPSVPRGSVRSGGSGHLLPDTAELPPRLRAETSAVAAYDVIVPSQLHCDHSSEPLRRAWCEHTGIPGAPARRPDDTETVSRAGFQRLSDAVGLHGHVRDAWDEAAAFMLGKQRGSIRGMHDVVVHVAHSSSEATEISYTAFVHAYNTVMGNQRRGRRQLIRSLFISTQTHADGLVQDEMLKFVNRHESKLGLLAPHFNTTDDWELMLQMSTRGLATSGDRFKSGSTRTRSEDDPHHIHTTSGSQSVADGDRVAVNFPEFERWWKFRMGLTESGHPVIPEFFEYRLSDVNDVWAAVEHHSIARQRWHQAANLRRHGPQLWGLLKRKLAVFQRTARPWGEMHQFYGSETAIYGKVELPWFIRYHESTFSAYWDTLSVVFLLYVCITAPIRSCFPPVEGNVSHNDAGSFSWCVPHRRGSSCRGVKVFFYLPLEGLARPS